MVELRRHFSGKPHLLYRMRAFVTDGCRQVWKEMSDGSAIAELELAVSETAGNVILHGLKGSPDELIELVLNIDPRSASVTFRYSGCGFEPQAIPPPDFSGHAESGYGIYLIEHSVDDLSFSRDDAGLCTIRFVKNRKRSAQETSAMDVLIERDGDVIVATPIAKHLALSNSESFRDDIVAALAIHHKLVIDMENIDFIDSRGCGAIISCLKHVSAAGGDLKLCDVKPRVRTILELIRLHRICEILETRDQAVFRFESVT